MYSSENNLEKAKTSHRLYLMQEIKSNYFKKLNEERPNKVFIDELYSKPPMRIYPTNKIANNHIDEIWGIDLADFSDYKTSKNKRCRYMFVIFDNFSQ